MRVLLADDQVWLRSALRLLLEHEANVEVVGEVGDVRTLPLSVNRLCPDLLFLDWHLSGLTTSSARQQLLDTVRAIAPHLYIIALTNDDYAANGSLSSLYGIAAIVNKAEPPERILDVLCQVTSSKSEPCGQASDSHLQS